MLAFRFEVDQAEDVIDLSLIHPNQMAQYEQIEEANRWSRVVSHARVDSSSFANSPNGNDRVLRPSYDERQIGAVLVSRLCCRRTVYATDPEGRCAVCR